MIRFFYYLDLFGVGGGGGGGWGMFCCTIFPDAFKVSKVIPLYKKGDSSLLVNYRPISLLPTISKIFEKVIHDQLYDYFDKYNLLAEQQYGFRKQHLQNMLL